MIANHIHHALAQVRELQKKILENQRFKGYSGRARAIGGTIALFSAFIMSSPQFPDNTAAHALGWGILALIGVLLNFGALIHWFLFDPTVKRDIPPSQFTSASADSLSVDVAASGADVRGLADDLAHDLVGRRQVIREQVTPGLHAVQVGHGLQ